MRPWEAYADPQFCPASGVDLIHVSRVLAGADPFLPKYKGTTVEGSGTIGHRVGEVSEVGRFAGGNVGDGLEETRFRARGLPRGGAF